jgi:hypothetical protein
MAETANSGVSEVMVASVNTTRRVLETVIRYVPEERLPAFIQELRCIPGNQSFLDTVARLEKFSKEK